MRVVKLAAAAAACMSLSGCWYFFIIPGSNSLTDKITGDKGDHCVPLTAKVGDAMPINGGKRGTIKSLSGRSGRCLQDGYPIRAEIVQDE